VDATNMTTSSVATSAAVIVILLNLDPPRKYSRVVEEGFEPL